MVTIKGITPGAGWQVRYEEKVGPSEKRAGRAMVAVFALVEEVVPGDGTTSSVVPMIATIDGALRLVTEVAVEWESYIMVPPPFPGSAF